MNLKRKLLILSILFLALWVGYLLYNGHTSNIHIALIVQLLFFVHWVLKMNSPLSKEIAEIAVNETVIETNSEKELNRKKSEVIQPQLLTNREEKEVYA